MKILNNENSSPLESSSLKNTHPNFRPPWVVVYDNTRSFICLISHIMEDRSTCKSRNRHKSLGSRGECKESNNFHSKGGGVVLGGS